MTARGIEIFFKDIARACTNAYKSLNIGEGRERIMLGVLAGVLLVVGGYFGYHWYVVRRDSAAQLAYSSCQQLLRDVQATGEPEAWVQLEQQAVRGYKAHSSSSFFPYFKVLEAQALHGMGKHSEAIDAMEQAYGAISTSNPFASQLCLTMLLMKLDSADEVVRTQALDQLKAFADEQGAASRDGALFYLGRYHWARGEVEQARDIWRLLVEAFPVEGEGASAWAQEASRLLAYMP